MPIGSILGGLISQGGANAAGAAAGQGGQQALQMSQDQANRDVARLSPWSGAGMGAEKELAALYGLGRLDPIGDQYNTYGLYQTPADRTGEQQAALGRFQTSPGYNFRLQQGVNALDRSASARGMNFSGAQAKALDDYGQGQASSEYGNYVNALSGIAGQGQVAANNANNASNAAMLPGMNAFSQGNLARASSFQTGANALASGIASGVNNAAAIGAYGMGAGWFKGGGGAGAGGDPFSGV